MEISAQRSICGNEFSAMRLHSMAGGGFLVVRHVRAAAS